MDVKISVPRTVWITVNRACNFRCLWCYAKDTKYYGNSSATFDYVKRIINILRELGVKSVLFIGGEPTLWPHLLEANQYASDCKIKTIIVSNAARFGDDDFWEAYEEHPNDHGGISIKGFGPEDLLRVAEYKNFDRVKLGIERAVKFWHCGAGIVYNSMHANSVVELAKFIMDCGARSMNITSCTPSFSTTSVESKYVVDLKTTVANIVRDYPELDRITHGRISFFMKLPLCLWPKDFLNTLITKKQISSVCQLQERGGLIFDIDGKVMMCNGLFHEPIGQLDQDFTDATTLTAFLNQPRINGYYDAINSYPSTKCIDCPMYTKCGGGCPLFWSIYKPEEVIPGW